MFIANKEDESPLSHFIRPFAEKKRKFLFDRADLESESVTGRSVRRLKLATERARKERKEGAKIDPKDI
jgi:hypothetical protein